VFQGTSYALVVQDPYTGLTRHFEPSGARAGVWWLTKVEDRNDGCLAAGTVILVSQTRKAAGCDARLTLRLSL
jgi:hypothetical protein